MKRIYFSSIVLLIALLSGLNQAAVAQTSTYSTAGAYVYTVPLGCTGVVCNVCGAAGGSAWATAGKGGCVMANVAVSSGQLLYVYVGGVGQPYSTCTGGTSLGGEQGGNGGTSDGGSGGGAGSDIRNSIAGGATSAGSLLTRILVGGGGGGDSYDCGYSSGGNGGYPAGGGGNNSCGCTNTTGGTQTGGGGLQSCTSGSTAGGFGAGGTGNFFGGGGGGGWYGGGGGYEGSGSGGSSTAQSVGINVPSSVTYSNGTQSGTGLVTITPLVPTVTATPGALSFAPTLVGTTAVVPQYTVLNGNYMGSSPLTLSLSGAPAGVFTIATDATAPAFGAGPLSMAITIPVFPTGGAQYNVYVNFTPAAAVTYTGTLTITGGGLGAPVNVPITGTGVLPCAGTPSAPLTVASPTSGGIYTNFNLSLTPAYTAGGYTYQWQSSPTGSAPWTNITGAVLPNYAFTGISASTYFQCVITCSGSGLSATSTPFQVTLAGLTPTGCTPTAANNYCCGFSIGEAGANAFTVTGNLGSLTDAFVTSGSTLYHDFSGSLNVTESPGGNPVAGIGGSASTNAMNVQMWVDFNNNGSFETSESIGGGAIPATTRTNITLSIPATVAPGVYRFRVVLDYASGNPAYPLIPACPTTAISYADTRDYTMIIAPAPCSGTPEAGIASTTAASSCAPPYMFTPTLINVGESNGSGITYNWQSSPNGITWSNVGGATGVIYTPTITALGVTYYRNSAACSGGGTGYSAPITVSLNPSPTPITPTPANLCTGVPTTLVSTPVGGNWTSSNTAVATTAGSLSGAVTGVAVGVATITYTLPTGCSVTAPVTVNTQPAAIGGPTAVCQGAGVTLTDASPGGSWTSSTPTVATIVAGTGVLNPTAPGTTNITYTSIFGCITSQAVTVNALPTLYITGPASYAYCTGSPSLGHVTLSGSAAGITYQLLLAGSPAGLPSLPGTGALLDFGIQSAPGVYTVVATNNVTGCSRTMVSSANIAVNPLPVQYTVSGGGSYCAGSPASAPHIFLSGSQAGVNYKLQLGGTTLFTIAGSGGSLDFGTATAAGCYTVLAQNASTGCTNPMLGSSCVTLNSLPTAFNILPPGGGSYCVGGTGVDIQLDFSNTGVTYRLYNGTSLVGTLSGTGAMLDFGMQSAAGTYTITGQNVTTLCSAPMAGASTITVNSLPNQHNVQTSTGGSSGSFCAGGAGVDIVLDASDGGINYQLYLGTTPVGVPQGGTGLSLDFGSQTAAGVYTVIATDATSLCTNNMLGSVTVSINPLPPAGTVTGGGNFCVGGPGVHIGINPTTVGISYQLMSSMLPLGSPMAGTGGAVDFGVFSTVGIYTVVATNTVTGCTANMAGVATISTNPLPYGFNVTGGGSYCSGSTGLPVGLDFSATGITYQLYRGGVSVGSPVSGTGAPITFGIQSVVGTYTVIGTNVSTACTGNMAGSAVISVNSLPALHLVVGGGNFCAGGAGADVGLNGSETGNSYQLFVGTSPVGTPLAGSGSLLDFGLQTIGGTYTIEASNTTTGCSRYMTGGVPVNVFTLPDVYSVTGGGLYCAGSPGVHVGLSGSVSGIHYQLYNGGGAVGLPMAGTGSALDFGIQVASGTYTIVAINSATSCSSNMAGSVNVATSPLPAVYNVTGGGNYCAGGTGSVIGLNGSDPSVNYQLFNGLAASGSPMPGTGAPLSFGSMTATGTYSIVATNAVTGCVSNMAGTASIAINPLPGSYAVTGGGNFCAGGAGEHIFLGGSAAGVNYQLYNDTSLVGSAMAGSGGGLDFGLQTTAGNYTVIASNPATLCTRNMTGSASISVYPLPPAHTVTGGGSYCAGGTGVNIGLDGSNAGILYQLYFGTTPVGLPAPGTGINLNFGIHASAGTYTIVAINNSTSCTSNMTGSAVVAIQHLPAAYNVTGGGNYCATGLGLPVYLSGSDAGVNYQLWNGTTAVGSPVAGTGTSINFGMETLTGAYSVTAVNPTTTCANNMTGTVAINILPVLLPSATVTSNVVGLACTGQTVTFTASPVNGGTAPTYQWLVNGTPSGSIGTTYSYIPTDGDKVTAFITSNYQCAIPDTGSGSMIVTVSPPEMPSVSVSVYPGTQICTGGTASFTATTEYGGTAPNLVWIKNSAFVATGTSYSYVPNNGDIVTFMLGSNFPCRLADTVFSANTTLTVAEPVLPVVSISTTPGTTITTGHAVTFTATVLHGGSVPAFQWVINSTEVPGATNASFTTSSLSNNDSVSCMVEGTCGLVGFNSVRMSVHAVGVGVTNVTSNATNMSLVPNPNKGDFTVKGSLSSAADQEVTLEVTDLIGQVVYSAKANAVGGNVNEHIQIGNLANGMYLLNLRSDNENIVFHFVIEQ